MATRAAFYLGNPMEDGKLLGCIAFDGYPNGVPSPLKDATDPESFERIVMESIASEDDWTPGDRFPFPWASDLFVTDFVYAFFDGTAWVTPSGCGWHPMAQAADGRDLPDRPQFPTTDSGAPYGLGHDSIIIVSRR